MNRISKCIEFQTKNMLISILWFVSIYAAICIAIFSLFAVAISNDSGSKGGMNAGFYFGAAIFAFVYAIASYKSNFNFLLMFGNSRRNIFLSAATANVFMSAILAVISILSLQIDIKLAEFFSKADSYSGSADLLQMIYNGNSNTAAHLLWFFVFFILICSFSMLYGALSYKLGKMFIIAFWVVFGLSLMSLPAMRFDGQYTVINAIKSFFCAGDANGMLVAPIHFLIAAFLFGGITYLLSSRQQQVA